MLRLVVRSWLERPEEVSECKLGQVLEGEARKSDSYLKSKGLLDTCGKKILSGGNE